jgi:transcriptional regulator with XRE-family HTH domain
MPLEGKDILLRFGKNLEAIKRRKNLSYRIMATRCNIDHSDIKKYVDGHISPTVVTIIELAKGLGVTPKELFDLDFGIDFTEETH